VIQTISAHYQPLKNVNLNPKYYEKSHAPPGIGRDYCVSVTLATSG
jgi:hypothetical protein